MSKSLSDSITNAEVMLAGIKTNQSTLSRRGIDELFVQEFETALKHVVELNNTQEQLKAQLRVKTSELEKEQSALASKLSEAKKVVKMDLPKTQWVEFGISDKH